MQARTWFSIRSVFRHNHTVDGVPTKLFEERVVLFLATDVEEALALGQQEALRFASSGSQPKLLAHLVAFELWETQLQSGEEVWSCLREVDIPDERFLDQVYEGERLGLRHREQS